METNFDSGIVEDYVENVDNEEHDDDEEYTWSYNYVPNHPLINTFIIMDDYKSEKQIDHHHGPTFDKDANFNYDNCMEDSHIIFIAREIKECNNILHIKASVGYYYVGD